MNEGRAAVAARVAGRRLVGEVRPVRTGERPEPVARRPSVGLRVAEVAVGVGPFCVVPLLPRAGHASGAVGAEVMAQAGAVAPRPPVRRVARGAAAQEARVAPARARHVVLPWAVGVRAVVHIAGGAVAAFHRAPRPSCLSDLPPNPDVRAHSVLTTMIALVVISP